jgi:hypothetical protein
MERGFKIQPIGENEMKTLIAAPVKRICDGCGIDRTGKAKPGEFALVLINDRYGHGIGLFCPACAAVAQKLVDVSPSRAPNAITPADVRNALAVERATLLDAETESTENLEAAGAVYDRLVAEKPEPKFLTILTDGTEFYNPEISTKDEVEARQRKADDLTAGNFSVVAIPLATVLASPKLLAACQDAFECGEHQVSCCCEAFVDATYDKLRAAISEATEGGAAALTTTPPQSPAPSPFTVCAYRPAHEAYPVLQVELHGLFISAAARRDELLYNELRSVSGGDQNIHWLYGQQPQPLE